MKSGNEIRVIVDVNIWLNFLIKKNFKAIYNLLLKRRVSIVFSVRLLAELELVVERPKFRKYFREEDVEKLRELIMHRADWFKDEEKVTICRDPEDNYLLDLALNSEADYLISHDKDLLVLNPFEQTKIINYYDFLEIEKKL
jgi:uncharacterized protein